MAVRNILKEGDNTLRKQCRQVTVFDKRLHILIDDMMETLKKADGIGLAAPQVGILKRVFVVVNDEGQMLELVNPEIIAQEGEQQEVEGCLSLPQTWGITRRPMTVTVKAQDRNGKVCTYTGSSLTARAFCHEIDHLDGILFTDNAIRILSPDELKRNDS